LVLAFHFHFHFHILVAVALLKILAITEVAARTSNNNGFSLENRMVAVLAFHILVAVAVLKILAKTEATSKTATNGENRIVVVVPQVAFLVDQKLPLYQEDCLFAQASSV
jgi:hypothetical protein